MELIEEIKKLVEKGVKLKEIEAAVSFPKNQLSAILKGHKRLPKKWHEILSAYVSLQNTSKKMTVDLPSDFVGVDKIGVIKADGTIEELKTIDQLPPDWVHKYQLVQTANLALQDLSQPTNGVNDLSRKPPRSNYISKIEKPKTPADKIQAADENKHPLWKEGDPKEGSMAFYMKYDCYTYNELLNKKK